MQNTPRIHAQPEDLVPRFLVRLMFGFVACVLGIVIFATVTDRPIQSTPPVAEILREKTIFLRGDMSGAARVLDGNGTLIADLNAEQGGFVAGIERVITRERNKIKADTNAPVVLQLREGNRLALFDPATGWSAELMGFGASNSRVFARLLDQH
ncbi:photosynthetic complex assembly protein PuhC [Roseobacter sp.]|uniref:photosynthetic complex assembly protein PuhC n=1 Tax=Roseobacter sp. TaxID=1907202 RepID=UPI00385BCA91